MTRQITMVGFLQAQNCTNLVSSWRHPESRTDFLTPEYFCEIARVLEQGKFQLAFFDDRLAMPDRFGNDHAHTIEHGIRCVKLDPVTVLMTMSAVTKRLGLGSTYSTTYYEPFHVARLFQTMDLMTHGRAAWNIVTSMNDGEAQNMGLEHVIEHDTRYDRADEFLEVVTGHWDSWDEDALIVDKRTGRFGDPTKVRRIDHRGDFFRSRGPFTVPRSPQGHPVLIQAGASGRGRRFAARWAEVVFTSAPTPEIGRRMYADQRAALAEAGRDPDDVSICTLAYTVAAATKSEAEDKMAEIETQYREIDALSLLSEALNFDFSRKGLDEPFTTEELESISGVHTMRDRVIRASGKPNPTVRDFIRLSGRSQPHGALVGGPREIADGLEEWFTSGVCDGFVLAATHIPGGYRDFVEHVVPELQRRGLYHQDYEGATLRENLGLARPASHATPAQAEKSSLSTIP